MYKKLDKTANILAIYLTPNTLTEAGVVWVSCWSWATHHKIEKLIIEIIFLILRVWGMYGKPCKVRKSSITN